MNKKQKILIIIGLGLILLISANYAWAQDQNTGKQGAVSKWMGDTLKWIGAGALGGIIYFIGFVCASIAAVAVTIAGWLANFAVGINSDLLNSPLVTEGWKICRDLANLGFVLFIIIIAISTILRYEEYAAKSTLAKLIAVALLVNFSLLGAGVFIDFSNMLMDFFIKNISGGSLSGLGTALVAPFGIQGYLETENVGAAVRAAGGSNALTPGGFIIHTISLLVIALMTFLVAFVLFALGVMFLIRYISLSILLVLAPLACLFWILPVTKNLWEKWWSDFMRWVLFAPAASFFLWLGVYFMKNYDNLASGALSRSAQGEGTVNFVANLTLVKDLYQRIALLVITGGFIIGGLIVANSLSITGAKTFYGWAQSAGKGLRGKVGSLSQRAAQRVAMTGARKEPSGEITTRGQRISAAISKVPGLRGVAQRISTFSAPQARAEEVEKYRKDNLTNLSNEAVIQQALNPAIRLNSRAEAATAQELAKRNLTGDARIAPLLNRYLQIAQRMGNINTVLNNRPDLAPKIDTTVPPDIAIGKVMQKIRADKADEISHDAFGQMDVVLNLDNSKLNRLGRAGEQRQKDAIENTINKAIANIGQLNPQQQTSLNRIEAQVRTLRNNGNW